MARVLAFDGSTPSERQDELACEEPLEIRLRHGPPDQRQRTRLTITLRTPGEDAELATGLLFSEGIIESTDDILSIEPSREPSILLVDLNPRVRIDRERIARTFPATASCGVCGKSMLEALEASCDAISSPMTVAMPLIHNLSRQVLDAQPAFAATGGLHAAALFEPQGGMLRVCEDVGRHNAVDKVFGHEIRNGRTRLSDRILFVSGRAGFELVQKAARMGIPVMVAVGAPTTLSVALAERFGLTLLGFVRDGRANCYTHPGRLV